MKLLNALTHASRQRKASEAAPHAAGRPAGGGSPGAPVQANLEVVDGLAMRGWAWAPDTDAELFTVRDGQREWDCAVIRLEREDVRQAKGAARLRLGFELELPSAAWIDAPAGRHLQLHVNGQPVGAPVHLHPAMLAQQAARLATSEPPEGAPRHLHAEWQYQLLLLVEHVGHARALHALPPPLQAFVRTQAERFKVEAVLAEDDGGAEGAPASPDADVPPPPQGGFHDLELLVFWRALRAFNDALGAGQSSQQALASVLATIQASPTVVNRLVFTLVPHFCSLGQYDAIRPFMDMRRLRALRSDSGPHGLSLQLPEMVRSGDYLLAAEMLETLVKSDPQGREGWLNTECLQAAFDLLAEARDPQTGGMVAEAPLLIECFLLFLDAQGRDYWGRLHDLHLLRAMVRVLRIGQLQADGGMGWSLERCVLRHFALVPDFWRTLDQSGWPAEEQPAWLPDLRRVAQQLIGWVDGGAADGGVRGGTPVTVASLLAHAPALSRLVQANSTDAAMLLREAAMALAGTPAAAEPAAAQALHELLASVSRHEAIRLAALPAATAEVVDASPPLRPLLRQVSVVGSLPATPAFERANARVAALHDAAAARDVAAVRGLLAQVAEDTVVLLDPLCGYLGVRLDALAVALALPVLPPAEASIGLTRVRARWHRAFDHSVGNPWPAAAVLDAWWALQRAGQQLPGAAGHDLRLLLAEMAHHMARRYGNRLGPRAPEGPLALRMTGQLPWQNTLVVVYSCRRNLETRIATIRQTWLRDLSRRGIPYVVLVGDGDDTLQGDVLALDVSDAYEELPAKTRAMVRWVLHHTDFEHLFKIDDDCHLAGDLFADASSHGMHHYVGRRLARGFGDTDRRWHRGRSSTELADTAIDKSPEPSIYADGGAGYALSRYAMQRLDAVLQTDAGLRLTRGAYMEDKLLGDLLALCDIPLRNTGHHALVRRRFGVGSLPVNAWQNAFFPGPDSPTLVTHADDVSQLPAIQQHATQRRLAPPRLWPSFQSPDMREQQLELLTPAERLPLLAAAPVLVVAVARNERVLMPHFLAHYRALGVQAFAMVDNLSDDGTREYLLARPDVVLYSCDGAYRDSHFGVAWQQAVCGAHALGKWVVLADIDEFLVYPGSESVPLADWLATQDRAGFDAVLTVMVDMYPQGPMSSADLAARAPFEACGMFDRQAALPWRLGSGWFSNGATWVSSLRHRLIPDSPPNSFTTQKLAVMRYRPWVRLTQGLHYASNVQVAPEPCWFAHFKYHAGFRRKVLTEVSRRQHFNGAEEYRKYLGLVGESRGTLSDPALSRAWTGSGSFQRDADR